MLFCKTCYLRTNEPVYLCVRCYISSEQSHPRHHEAWQWTIEAAKPGGLARGIHCNECQYGIIPDCFRQVTHLTVSTAMRSVEDLKAHPHISYVQVYTEKHLNRVIARSYRECQKKARRVDDMMSGFVDEMVADGSDQCMMCFQSMSCHYLMTKSTIPNHHCRDDYLVLSAMPAV